MSRAKLEIILRSALCSGSGLGQPGYVDRDAVFDQFGLPYLPGRRLKGLLRDAYREVTDTGFFDLPGPEKVFGEPGRSGSKFHISDAHLPEGSGARSWLRAMADRDLRIDREEVIAFYSSIRRQTAVNRDSGAPNENTLRATRTLRKSLRFEATIGGIPYDCRDALKFASQALRQMGLSRTRGLGQVECTLRNDTTQQADDQDSQTGEPSLGGPGEYLLPFAIDLKDPVIIPSLAGDPNTTLTEEFIPGSTVLGVLAACYIASGKLPMDRFRKLFCSGHVRFLSAYPSIEGHGGPRRSAPMPHSIRQSKSEPDLYFNLAVQDPGDEPIRRVRGWCSSSEIQRSGISTWCEVETRFDYHHARAGDPRIGRAVGEQHTDYGLAREQSGAFFGYESIQGGQSFIGAILGTHADLAMLLGLIRDGTQGIRVGRSRSAQYGGGATWNWGSITACDCAGETSGGNFWSPDIKAPGDVFETDRVIVTLLSPLLSVNEYGHPTAIFPYDELEARLRVRIDRENCYVFSRTNWQGGYLAHQKLPKQQVPAISSGSVFVVALREKTGLSRDQLVAAEAMSYGMRTEEGFGRIDIAVAAPDCPNFVDGSDTSHPGSVQLSASDPAYTLALSILKQRVLQAARHDGRKLARDYRPGSIPNHLLSRVMQIMESARTLPDAEQALRGLRGGSKSKLEKYRFRNPFDADQQRCDLHEFLRLCCGFERKSFIVLQNKVFAVRTEPWAQVFESNPLMDDDVESVMFGERVVRSFVSDLLRSMLWANRQLDANNPTTTKEVAS